jgi:hypothetical protein
MNEKNINEESKFDKSIDNLIKVIRDNTFEDEYGLDAFDRNDVDKYLNNICKYLSQLKISRNSDYLKTIIKKTTEYNFSDAYDDGYAISEVDDFIGFIKDTLEDIERILLKIEGDR